MLYWIRSLLWFVLFILDKKYCCSSGESKVNNGALKAVDDTNTPGVTPIVKPAVRLAVIPDVTPSVTPAVTPDVTPAVTPDVTPSVTPAVTPAVGLA